LGADEDTSSRSPGTPDRDGDGSLHRRRGSTLLAQRTDPDVFRHLIETHLALVRTAVEDGGGIAIRTEDGAQ